MRLGLGAAAAAVELVGGWVAWLNVDSCGLTRMRGSRAIIEWVCEKGEQGKRKKRGGKWSDIFLNIGLGAY